MNFPCLVFLDCSSNKIQYLHGFSEVSNLKWVNLSSNSVVFNRESINELLQLKSVLTLNIANNPLSEGGLEEQEIAMVLTSKLPSMLTLNSSEVRPNTDRAHLQESIHTNSENDSPIREEPYQLFMGSASKPTSK